MLKIILCSTLCILSGHGYADLQALDNEDLNTVHAQAGADLSLYLSLNHKQDGTYQLTDLCSTTGSTYEQCRLGLAFNSRYHNGEYVDREGNVHNASGAIITGSAIEGRKLWLVMKGLQGTIDLQHVGLDGTDLTYTEKGGSQTIVKSAIQLSFDPQRPIVIRNFGFESLSVEMDSAVETNAANIPGYWQKNTSGTGLNKLTNGKYDYSTPVTVGGLTYNSDSFDHGREVGFTGMLMNANLVMNGTIKVFGCDGSHPRC
ncbi:hypothetical protein GCM10023206_26390 [Acinetobacter puyangensis]|uniref:Uncharacterized protein n=1 Tax=Acinetobacter puyangensis TaxID=1096779 RepID=A0A240E4S2_9GAMM|nr:hypothetical protein [Acinetobacter puyangensis]SNX43592.1 hypothetical protein SAMN05421731_101634 [Acinetobacter puyangensis]